MTDLRCLFLSEGKITEVAPPPEPVDFKILRIPDKDRPGEFIEIKEWTDPISGDVWHEI